MDKSNDKINRKDTAKIQSRLRLFTCATKNKDKFNFQTNTLDPQWDL